MEVPLISQIGPVSSPISTSGAGTMFEQNVAAYWLAQLLVQGVPPIFIKSSIREVSFQTERFGWKTDDFLVLCENSAGTTKKLLGQVKRGFTVSSSNAECKKAIKDFWQDFNNSELFSQSDDRFVLVTLRGTNVLLESFNSLLSCARASTNRLEFEQRLAVSGLLSAKAIDYCKNLCEIISEIECRQIIAGDIWKFLITLHVISLDLTTSTRQTEALAKNLLAHTCNEGDVLEAATTSWNALIVFGSDAMVNARSISREDLPLDLREKHSLIGVNDRRVLKALNDHLAIILNRIDSSIGQCIKLRRSALVQKTISELELSQVVLVSGPAGSGKSVIAKDVLELMSRSYFTYGFRSEEFAKPHFDATLNQALIPANGTELQAILAGQNCKVIFIESAERLLEKSTRDAFADLVLIASSDPALRILITCREYSKNQFINSFLRSTKLKSSIIEVPLLGDDEIAEVKEAIPSLVSPLESKVLRDLLRNPYFLNMATSIAWSSEETFPENEQEFRDLCWTQIICASPQFSRVVSLRRGELFQEIAVSRARSLTMYVTCSDFDHEILDSLKQDSLLTSPGETHMLVAPAHDVLEDWAILHWLDERYQIGEHSLEFISKDIGGHPALRRSYRKWVSEILERDSDVAEHLFKETIAETGISSQFRDDTLLSILSTSSSLDFLLNNDILILQNERVVLKLLIHLLRVACVKPPCLPIAARNYGSILNVPEGPAWEAILSIVSNNIESFVQPEFPLLIGLIEDVTKNMSWHSPDFTGVEYAITIAHHLLPEYEKSLGSTRKRLLRVISKVPQESLGLFQSLLSKSKEGKVKLTLTEMDLRDILFSATHGMPTARDIPNLVLSIALEYFLIKDDDIQNSRYWGNSSYRDARFGIKEGLRRDFFPASALQGPWTHLLAYHPNKTLAFYFSVFNHSIDCYVKSKAYPPIDEVNKIKLTFADGTNQEQWGNERVWNHYRGTTTGPYVLLSMLMALEKYLLTLAEKHPKVLDGFLLMILHGSESLAMTAVVASVAAAHPHQSVESLFVLLKSPECIRLDNNRLASESKAVDLSEMLSGHQPGSKIYIEERDKANSLPHRKKDLENAILELQLGPLTSRVQTVLDQELAILPPEPKRTDNQAFRQISLHRMDARQFNLSKYADSERSDLLGRGDTSTASILLEPKPLPPDLKTFSENKLAPIAGINEKMKLLMWAHTNFTREVSELYDSSDWETNLSLAISFGPKNKDILTYLSGGPGIVAAVCIRDHWEKLSKKQKNWCTDRLCFEVMQHANDWSFTEKEQRNSMAADRATARILPLLLGKTLSKKKHLQVRKTIISACTHPILEVRQFFAWGIAEFSWIADRELVFCCINAVAKEANLIKENAPVKGMMTHNYEQLMEQTVIKAAQAVRRNFDSTETEAVSTCESLDINEYFGAYANSQILIMLSNGINDYVAIGAFTRASQTLVGMWSKDKAQKRYGRNGDGDYHTEESLLYLIPRFLMRTSKDTGKRILEPILGVVNKCPDEVYWILKGLTAEEDGNPNTEQYWYLWNLFADVIKKGELLSKVALESRFGDKMLSAIFLSSGWKDNVTHWKSLKGFEHNLNSLFESLPFSPVVLDKYLRFLFNIGKNSLPSAFPFISNSLMKVDGKDVDLDSNTIFLLEVLLQRHVYGRPLELKMNVIMRTAIFFLLEFLVKNGSSAAFQMRDDFITPCPK